MYLYIVIYWCRLFMLKSIRRDILLYLLEYVWILFLIIKYEKNILGGKYIGEMKVNECIYLIINKFKGMNVFILV